jgi:hypothetical protein
MVGRLDIGPRSEGQRASQSLRVGVGKNDDLHRPIIARMRAIARLVRLTFD